ncbi:hypothetical protein H5410_021302 [Solanum commersonii]|uniref:Uncharacterized protein n=1 Tax=Solanum commersonii TaxID=4109 RepID=A0A9J5ZC85_SOLCO|nr:hypothetical protein H5410_021302 [Solanum commersonii]
MIPDNKGVWKYSNSSAKEKAISETSTVDGKNVGSTTHVLGQNANVVPKESDTVRKGKGVGNTTQLKRPRVTGMGVFQDENDFIMFVL